jgi:hypothetical protein
VREAPRLHRQVLDLYLAGRYKEALPLARKVFAVTRRLLGEKHPDFNRQRHGDTAGNLRGR